MAFDIVGFDSTYKVPRFAAQLLFSAGVITGASAPLAVLCVGMKTSAGSMVADNDVVQIQSEDDADTYAGAGSQLARMLYKALALKGTVPIYGAAVAEPSGTAATATILVAGTYTAGGTIFISIAGETVPVNINAGDNPTTVAASIVTAVTNKSRWPITATSSTGTATLTCKNKGVQGLDWILNVDGSKAPAGMTLTVTGSATVGSSTRVRLGASSTGTGVEDITNILTKLQTARYARIAAAQNDATNAAAWKSQVNTLAGPLSLILEHVIFGWNETATTAQALAGGTLNAVRGQVLWARNCESHPCEIAAANAALRANTEGDGLVPDYDGLAGKGTLVGIAPVRAGFESDLPLDSEANTALSNGVTPVTTGSGSSVIIRAVTSYCHLGSSAPYLGGTADYRTIDIGDAVVTDFVAIDLQLKWQTVFRVANPYVGPDTNPNQADAPSGVATPLQWTSYVNSQLAGYFAANQIEDPANNPPVSTFNDTAKRIQSVVPLVVRRLQHQIGVIVRQQQVA